jgi:hypothetical protein
MASWKDLESRVDALEATGRTVAVQYQGQGLPKWLAAVATNDILVVNVKGVRLNDTLCVVKLAELEKLLGSAAAVQWTAARTHDDSLAVAD